MVDYAFTLSLSAFAGGRGRTLAPISPKTLALLPAAVLRGITTSFVSPLVFLNLLPPYLASASTADSHLHWKVDFSLQNIYSAHLPAAPPAHPPLSSARPILYSHCGSPAQMAEPTCSSLSLLTRRNKRLKAVRIIDEAEKAHSYLFRTNKLYQRSFTHSSPR